MAAPRYDVLTLHPAMVEGPLGQSIIGRARQGGLIDVRVHDMREFGLGRHRSVDDTPYGGGSGMVLRVDVVDQAISAVRTANAHVILLDPAGARLEQARVRELSAKAHIVFVCGHYEGIDGRVREHLVDEVLSIGDYVLTGGELAACVVIDALGRLQDGVLGNPQSAVDESFSTAMLEAPHFTRPREYRGWSVPEVLVEGNHARIAEWKSAEALRLTKACRPDLLAIAANGPKATG